MTYSGPAQESIHPLGYFDQIARIADIVARKTQEIPGGVGAFLLDIEKKVRSKGLRGTMKSLIQHFQNAGAIPKDLDLSSGRLLSRSDGAKLEGFSEWLMLVERIHCHGRRETIENYPEYMISLDGL